MYRLTPLIALVILLVVYLYYPSNLMTVGVLLAVWYWYSNMREETFVFGIGKTKSLGDKLKDSANNAQKVAKNSCEESIRSKDRCDRATANATAASAAAEAHSKENPIA